MDNDFNEGIEDILPPLPSTPQQTLFSFFKKSQDLNKESRNKKSKNQLFENIHATQKNVSKHNEVRQSLPLNIETSSDIVIENIQQNEVNSTNKEILNIGNNYDFLNEADIKNKGNTKFNKKGGAANEKEPSSGKDSLASFPCRDVVNLGTSQFSLPTPFPLYNHVNCDLVHHEPIKRFLNEELNADKICDFSKITDDYKSLLDKQIKKKSFVDGADVQAEKTEFRLVEDWLLILVEQYPDFPVKKFFQHFLSCQKSIITKNIQRNEAAINNTKSIWERDAEVQLINSVLDDHKNKETLEKNRFKKKSDVKDIRFLLKKPVKKKSSLEKLSKYETKTSQKVEEVEVTNDSIIDVEHLKESYISSCDIKSIDIIHPSKQEQTSPSKINISINGLLGKAIQKREQRKEKRNRRREFFNGDNLNKDLNEVSKEKECELINEKSLMQENTSCAHSDVVREDSDILVQRNPSKVNTLTEDYNKMISKDIKVEKRVNSKDIRAMFSNIKEDLEDSIIEIKTSAPHLEVNFQDDPLDQKLYTNLLNNIDNKLSLNVDPVSPLNGSSSDDDPQMSIRVLDQAASPNDICVKNSISTFLEKTSSPRLNCDADENQVKDKQTFDIKLNESLNVKLEVTPDVLLKQQENLNPLFNCKKETFESKQFRPIIAVKDDIKIESEKQEVDIQQHFVDNKKGSKRKNFLSNKDSNKKYKFENEKMSNKVDLVPQSDGQRSLCEHSILVDGLIENINFDSTDCIYVTGIRKEEEISSEKTDKINVRRSSRNKRKVDYFENFVSPLKIDSRSKKLAKCSSEPVLGVCSKVPQSCFVEKKDFTNDADFSMNNKRTESSLKKKPTHSKFNERSPKLKPALELVLNEVVVNSFLSWTEKYQPNKPRFVLGDRAKVRELFDWLNTWKEHHDLVAKKKALKASKKRKESDSDSDLSFSEDEFGLSNTLLLTGPVGCGTTAAVVACAKQMQFKVLEINPSILRTGKQVLDRVAEAVVSHQIQKKHPTASKVAFFTKLSDKPETVEDDEMSLVLFEHVDIVYEDHDKGFWQGLNSLRQLSKRPIILTANDLSKAICDDKEGVCMQSISLERPPTEQLLPMMQIICLIEHVFVPKEFLLQIIKFCNNDVRKTMLQLQFWLEQGKEPMYKLWKERQQNQSNIGAKMKSPSEISSNSLVKAKTQCNDKSIQTHPPIVAKDISLADNFEKVDQPIMEPVKILVPCVNLTNFTKNCSEDFFNIETISACNLWSNQAKNSHFSFIKKTNQKAAGDTSLQNLSNIIDCVSEMDCFLHSRYDYQEKDIYPWSASLTDSLVDFLTIEIDVSPPYPVKVMLDSAKSVVENCYRRCHETDKKLVFIQQRNNNEELAFQERIKCVMPISSEHRHFNQDVLPFLRNMCSSEEQKRIVQSRRKNRRFLHYLDTISLCLDEKILKKLATSPFSVS